MAAVWVMKEEDPLRRQIDSFVLEEIDSVPHLEALLLVWNRRLQPYSVGELAHLLYISAEHAQAILYDLQQRGLVNLDSGSCAWNPDSRHAALIPRVDETYRRELVRISSMIHSKASPAVRQFARAFRLKKD
ncbi:MAG: hypothetical protein WCC14_01210 [Acidobacteriaceae bacterium]